MCEPEHSALSRLGVIMIPASLLNSRWRVYCDKDIKGEERNCWYCVNLTRYDKWCRTLRYHCQAWVLHDLGSREGEKETLIMSSSVALDVRHVIRWEGFCPYSALSYTCTECKRMRYFPWPFFAILGGVIPSLSATCRPCHERVLKQQRTEC